MSWATLDGLAPAIIAHRGASGEFPEHCLAGYQRALDQGADIIEPDLVPSRDGVLFCRHEPQLARTTDVAESANLLRRGRQGDWSSVDLDAAEIDQLRCRQPFPGRSPAYDGRFAPPRFTAMLEWAGRMAAERGHRVCLYPEIKQPQAMAAAGVDPVPLFIDLVSALPPQVDVLVQCFDVEALRRIHLASGLPCALLLDSRSDPELALAQHGDWLAGLALSKKLLAGRHPQQRIETIHRAGLRIDVWTFRDDEVGPAFAAIEDELRWFMQLGVDRLFCDFPATAIAERARLTRSKQG